MSQDHKAVTTNDPSSKAALEASQEQKFRCILPIDAAHMSEYVCCWRVQYAYNLTTIQRNNLLESLLDVDGAIKECLAWGMVNNKIIEVEQAEYYFVVRSTYLYTTLFSDVINKIKLRVNKDKKQQITFDNTRKERILEWATRQLSDILSRVIYITYQGEKPEKRAVLGLLSSNFIDFINFFREGKYKGKYDDEPDYDDDYQARHKEFYLKHFLELYTESLLLKREDVREYCRNNQIPQIHETSGLMFDVTSSERARETSINEASRPRASKRDSWSAEEKAAAAKQWYDYYRKLPLSRERWACHIAMLKFGGNKHEKIFDIVFSDEKGKKPGTKRTRISRFDKLVRQIATDKKLPIPPGWEKDSVTTRT